MFGVTTVESKRPKQADGGRLRLRLVCAIQNDAPPERRGSTTPLMVMIGLRRAKQKTSASRRPTLQQSESFSLVFADSLFQVVIHFVDFLQSFAGNFHGF
jgi:hypothetical protein